MYVVCFTQCWHIENVNALRRDCMACKYLYIHAPIIVCIGLDLQLPAPSPQFFPHRQEESSGHAVYLSRIYCDFPFSLAINGTPT